MWTLYKIHNSAQDNAASDLIIEEKLSSIKHALFYWVWIYENNQNSLKEKSNQLSGKREKELNHIFTDY